MAFSHDGQDHGNVTFQDYETARNVYDLLKTQPMIIHVNEGLGMLSRLISETEETTSESDWAARNVLYYIKATPNWGKAEARNIVIANLAIGIAFAYEVKRKIDNGELGIKIH